jgi:broad specificity phosphatase PhoE
MNKFLACFITLFLLASHVSWAQQTVFLIRHAEKIVTNDKDPALTEAGIARANGLVDLFNNAKPSAIFATQFQRTQLTAKPLSEAIDVPITVLEINADNTDQYPTLLMEKICVLPKESNVLVVGHSNTLPAIVEAWTIETVKPIADDEHNRFFMVKIKDCKAEGFLDLLY